MIARNKTAPSEIWYSLRLFQSVCGYVGDALVSDVPGEWRTSNSKGFGFARLARFE